MKKLLFVFLWCLVIVTGVCYARSYSAIDSRALRAPEINSQEELSKLVSFLTDGYDKEEDKARVILAWIVKNIDYDDYKFAQDQKAIKHPNSRRDFSVPESDILKVHLGVCRDIADLYVSMASMANLKARTVSGYAGNNLTLQNYDENIHAWVIVSIDGKEEFVDPTWAINGGGRGATANISNNYQYAAELKRRESRTFHPNRSRSIDEDWFMTKPKTMIKTHFPLNEEDQLLKRPIKLQTFLRGTFK